MPPAPQCTYFLYETNTPVRPQDTRWQAPLPQDRGVFSGTVKAAAIGRVSHGMYFEAAHAFLSSNGYEPLLKAVSKTLLSPMTIDEINKINIILEKHGEYYHPGRIEVLVKGQTVALVLNVALSSQGRACLQREFGLLRQLEEAYAWKFLPQVYAMGEVKLAGGPKASMFLGQWFQGFHEFHLVRDPDSGEPCLVVWDPLQGPRPLSTSQAEAIYEQAATILTAYFNLMTFEQVFAWHHAAGDFIVNIDQGQPRVKLITVRRYTPLFEQIEHDAETFMQALLVFLLNLSIRMRLDRFDGVGDMAWAQDVAVPATVQGFFKGLDLQLAALDLPQEVVGHFRNYLKRHSKIDLLDALTAVARRFDPAMPGIDLVMDRLGLHAASLRAVLDRL